jgi:hypothetical protein
MASRGAEQREGEGKFGLWMGFLGGPIAWLANLQASYSLVPWTCQHGKHFLLHVSSALFLCLAVGAAFLVKGSSIPASVVRSSKNQGMEEVAPFMGQVGFWMSMLFALLIAAQAVPTFVLSPCAE